MISPVGVLAESTRWLSCDLSVSLLISLSLVWPRWRFLDTNLRIRDFEWFSVSVRCFFVFSEINLQISSLVCVLVDAGGGAAGEESGKSVDNSEFSKVMSLCLSCFSLICFFLSDLLSMFMPL